MYKIGKSPLPLGAAKSAESTEDVSYVTAKSHTSSHQSTPARLVPKKHTLPVGHRILIPNRQILASGSIVTEDVERARLDVMHDGLSSGISSAVRTRHVNKHVSTTSNSRSMFTARETSPSSIMDAHDPKIAIVDDEAPHENEQRTTTTTSTTNQHVSEVDDVVILCRFYLPSSCAQDGHPSIIECVRRAITRTCSGSEIFIDFETNASVSRIGIDLVCQIVFFADNPTLKALCRRLLIWDEHTGIAIPFDLFLTRDESLGRLPSRLWKRPSQRKLKRLKHAESASSVKMSQQGEGDDETPSHWKHPNVAVCYGIRTIRIPGECFLAFRDCLPHEIAEALFKFSDYVKLRWSRTFVSSDCYIHLEYDISLSSSISYLNTITALIVRAVESMASLTIDVPLKDMTTITSGFVRAEGISKIIHHKSLAAWVYRTHNDTRAEEIHSLRLERLAAPLQALSTVVPCKSPTTNHDHNQRTRISFLPWMSAEKTPVVGVKDEEMASLRKSVPRAIERIHASIEASMERNTLILMMGHQMWNVFSKHCPRIDADVLALALFADYEGSIFDDTAAMMRRIVETSGGALDLVDKSIFSCLERSMSELAIYDALVESILEGERRSRAGTGLEL